MMTNPRSRIHSRQTAWPAVAAVGWAVLLLVAVVAGPARAALTWERSEVDLGTQDPSREPGTLEARFPFTNTGAAAVEIRALQPGCSCTVAELTKRRFEPGERGELVLRFEVGERTGPQEKLLTVETSDDDPRTGPVVLRLRAEIPAAVRLRPSFVLWTRGEAPEPKALGVEAPAGNLASVRVESSTPEVTAEPRAVEPGRRWEVTVRPTGGTASSLIATLKIVCRFAPPPGGAAPAFERTFKAYAAVKPPPPALSRR